MTRLAFSASLLGLGLAGSIEQVHLNLGKTTSELTVQWVTQEESKGDTIRWGTSSSSLSHSAAGDSREFTQDANRTWHTHVATMTGLDTNTEYYYMVGDSQNGFSDVFKVMNRRKRPEGEPYKHILLGDMGSACAFTLCNACTQKSTVCNATTCAKNTTVGLVGETDADMFLHVGDFAYNLGSDNGRVGDQFFNNIEQIATRTPYMVSHGNHEDSAIDLAHYIESFRGMPSNAVPSEFNSSNGVTTNTLYFSWDHGLVHYIAMSTELWFGVHDDSTNLTTFLDWVKKDLEAANKNRENAPWIVIHGHRSIYCSCDGDCDGDAAKVRADMEPIMFEYGVDFFINGHEHNYERMWPTYKSKSDQSNINPKATVYVVTGAAGSHEMHEPFTKPQPSWSAFRSNSFSYTRMFVYNSSHIHWQQVQTDPTLFPGSDYGRVIDDTWFVQESHGPFNASLAPKVKPTSCGDCSEYDHWAPLLGLEDGSGRSMVDLIAEFRKKNGDDAWREKLQFLMNGLQSNLTVWEDVREDGNSDGAWAKDFKWTTSKSA
eukprot:TRINITY_DN378_c0_g1_i4.p1 TRINITY_DN378_c0_g1~~TRINITY_DN378_c0_g1_i4.p1  ORF type:complete len:544 (+),score=134.07 TRINITY_DN378_c0_g1_i4:45-1676(+)